MEQKNTSILSRFPEYGFKSTSMYNPKSGEMRKGLVAMSILGFVIGFMGIGSLNYSLSLLYLDIFGHGLLLEILTTLSIVVTVFLYLFFGINRISKWYQKGINASSFADYIQTKGKMRFFVKDGKFGLVKWNNFKIFIPAKYDKLMWVHENEVMKAYVNGEEFLIDIHNNKLS